MKIISKLFDYYDKVGAYGVDDIYYKRVRERFEFKASERGWTSNQLRDYHMWYDTDEYEWGHNTIQGYHLFLIGFCGDFYPCINVRYRKDSTPDKIFYDPEKFYNEVTTYGYPRGQFGDNQKLKFKQSVNEFFDARQYQKYANAFVDYNCPIFSIRLTDTGKTELFTNIILKDFNFQKAVDPYSAYQRISSYISGVLGTKEHELVQISDLSMRDKKGFDKWSFKKQKTKRLTKRKK